MRTTRLWAAIALLPAPAFAQTMLEGLARPNTILVSATGKVETAPDMATMTLSIRGEGKTPDGATAALAARQKAVIAGLRGLDPKLEVRTGDIAFREIRGGNCGDADMDDMSTAEAATLITDAMETASNGAERSAKGPCRVTGHRATIETTVLLASVKDAGTAVGLAGRLGVTQASVGRFTLRDDTAAARRALEQAMANARTQAAALAAASGSRLGPVVSIMDGDAGGRMMNRAVAYDMVAAPAALAPPPVAIAITPTPVETSAQIIVTFALLP